MEAALKLCSCLLSRLSPEGLGAHSCGGAEALQDGLDLEVWRRVRKERLPPGGRALRRTKARDADLPWTFLRDNPASSVHKISPRGTMWPIGEEPVAKNIKTACLQTRWSEPLSAVIKQDGA